MRLGLLLVAMFTLIMVGCGDEGDTEDVTVSATCDEQMQAAANESDPTLADPLIRETASDCQTVEEWLEALRRYPAALGIASADDVGEVDVEALCGPSDMADTPVCQNAVDEGIIPEDWWE